MDQYSAEGNLPPPPPSSSPLKKLLPFFIVGTFMIVIIAGMFVLFSNKSSRKTTDSIPASRPTATPFQLSEPTIPIVTKPVSTPSASVSPAKIGRLIFIKDGDIYHSDLSTFSLLVKNTTPAGDKLSWSPKGKLLAWRPKSTNATPSALTIYNKENSLQFTLYPSKNLSSEVIDYAWSTDDKEIAVLFRDNSYNISLFSVSSPSSSPSANLLTRVSSIKQIIWPKNNSLIFAGDDGINSIEIISPSNKLLVSNKNVSNMKLSPKRDKILYSTGDAKKSDLYLINIDGTSNQLINPKPAKLDMGKTNLSETVLDGGFVPYGDFMPSGEKLIVGYHYQQFLPLVGIYDLKQSIFTAIAPFALRSSDFMIDEFRLFGERVNTTATPSWQLSLFTIEDDAKFGIIRVIPGASSPSFFTSDSGNF